MLGWLSSADQFLFNAVSKYIGFGHNERQQEIRSSSSGK